MNIRIKTTKVIPKSAKGRKLKYPFDKIPIGKYMEVPAGTAKEKKNYYVVVRSAHYYARRHNWKFEARLINGVGQIHRVK